MSSKLDTDESTFLIHPFKIGRLSRNHAILYSRAGILDISNDAMVAALEELQRIRNSGRHCLSLSALNSALSSLSDSAQFAINFLCDDAKALQRIEIDNKTKGRLEVVTDNPALDVQLQASLQTDISEGLVDGTYLRAVLTLDYSMGKMRQLIGDAMHDPFAVIFSAYIIGRTLVIDAPYSRSFSTPCHFCQVKAIFRKARHLNKGWYAVAATLLESDTDRLFSGEVRPLESEACAYHFASAIRQWVSGELKDDRLGHYTELDLNTGVIRMDIAPHFQTCTCLDWSSDAAA